MPLAEPLLLPDSSRRLLAEIRVASLERFERARRFERLRFELAPLVLPGAAIALPRFASGPAGPGRPVGRGPWRAARVAPPR